MISMAWVAKCYFESTSGVLTTYDLPMFGIPILVQCGRILAILINENDLNPTGEKTPAPKLKNHKGDVNLHHTTEFLAAAGSLVGVALLPFISPSVSWVLYTYAGLGIFNAVLLDTAGSEGRSVPTRRVKFFAVYFMYKIGRAS